MRLAFSILFFSSLLGCGAPPTQGYRLEAVAPQNTEWLVTATIEALEFWDEHGLELNVEPNGLPVLINDDLPEHALGQYGFDAFNEYGVSIRVVSGLEGYALGAKCVIAHEIGHAYGMDHVESEEGTNLMNPVITLCGDECCWSKGDEAEFATATLSASE